jgi:hypothetical protein
MSYERRRIDVTWHLVCLFPSHCSIVDEASLSPPPFSISDPQTTPPHFLIANTCALLSDAAGLENEGS